METNSFKHNWENLELSNIIGGKTADNVSFLELFLKDYMSLFKVKTVNPQCNSCLKTYLNDYKLKKQIMSNDSNYRLKTKYNGLPLEVSGKNSSISVTNNNLTDAYAKILLKRYKEPSLIFEKFPIEEEKKEVKKTSKRTSKK